MRGAAASPIPGLGSTWADAALRLRLGPSRPLALHVPDLRLPPDFLEVICSNVDADAGSGPADRLGSAQTPRAPPSACPPVRCVSRGVTALNEALCVGCFVRRPRTVRSPQVSGAPSSVKGAEQNSAHSCGWGEAGGSRAHRAGRALAALMLSSPSLLSSEALAVSLPPLPAPAPPKTPEPSSDHCINPVSLARSTLFRRSFEVSSREWLRSSPVGVQGQHPCLLPAAPAAAWPPGFRPAGLHAALRARAGGVVRHRDRPPLPPALRWCSVRTLFSSFPAQSSRVPGTAWGALGRLPGTQCRISGMRG